MEAAFLHVLGRLDRDKAIMEDPIIFTWFAETEEMWAEREAKRRLSGKKRKVVNGVNVAMVWLRVKNELLAYEVGRKMPLSDR